MNLIILIFLIIYFSPLADVISVVLIKKRIKRARLQARPLKR